MCFNVKIYWDILEVNKIIGLLRINYWFLILNIFINNFVSRMLRD